MKGSSCSGNTQKKFSIVKAFLLLFFFNSSQPFDYVSSFPSIINSKTKYLPSWGKLYHLKFQNKAVKQNVKKHSTNKTIQQLLLRFVALSESDQNQVLVSFCHLTFC